MAVSSEQSAFCGCLIFCLCLQLFSKSLILLLCPTSRVFSVCRLIWIASILSSIVSLSPYFFCLTRISLSRLHRCRSRSICCVRRTRVSTRRRRSLPHRVCNGWAVDSQLVQSNSRARQTARTARHKEIGPSICDMFTKDRTNMVLNAHVLICSRLFYDWNSPHTNGCSVLPPPPIVSLRLGHRLARLSRASLRRPRARALV